MWVVAPNAYLCDIGAMEPRLAVTGCAGFIGSNMVDYLLSQGYEVIGFDNFSTGKPQFIEKALKNPNFKLIEFDLLHSKGLEELLLNCHRIYHFSANADVKNGPKHTDRDLMQNTVATYNVLEASKRAGVQEFVFSSTGSVYGESSVIPTPECAPFPIQTSLYGASKLAGEGLAQAYASAFDLKVWIFRFVSILGDRYSHGHVFDFMSRLYKDPCHLQVLGNGSQRKSYLNVSDCVQAIDIAISKTSDQVNIFNLGHEEYCDVKQSISWILDELKLSPEVSFEKKERGWIGDNPFILLNTKKIMDLGWMPRYSIEQSIRDTVRFLVENSWLFSRSRYS